jgi:CubicO group peptidase (beta-lactamase class C family)
VDVLATRIIKKTGVLGIAIAVVHGDKLIYAKGFGVRKIGSNLNVGPDTVFQLASVSKSWASTVVAGAVGRGRVKWDDPVQHYLLTFTLSNPLNGSQIKIEDMFSHRSDLPGAGDDLEYLGCNRTEVTH